jgi:hypothetical protein
MRVNNTQDQKRIEGGTRRRRRFYPSRNQNTFPIFHTRQGSKNTLD